MAEANNYQEGKIGPTPFLPQVEFLYECVEKTVKENLPDEVIFLKKYDRFCERINRIVDMPDRVLNLLFHFLRQNEGRLSKRTLGKEFSKLTQKETRQIEDVYNEIFNNEHF